MGEFVVREFDLLTSSHKRFIKFDLDDGKIFCYRSRKSFNAFFYGDKERNKNGDIIYVDRLKMDHDMDVEIWGSRAGGRAMEEVLSRDNDLSLVEYVSVKNIWDFYILIGYDYKKKKFIQEERK